MKWLNLKRSITIRISKREFVDSLGLEVIGNCEDEIAGAMLEINSRLDGCWDGPDYKVNKILQPHNICYRSGAYLSATFVEHNPGLWDS